MKIAIMGIVLIGFLIIVSSLFFLGNSLLSVYLKDTSDSNNPHYHSQNTINDISDPLMQYDSN